VSDAPDPKGEAAVAEKRSEDGPLEEVAVPPDGAEAAPDVDPSLPAGSTLAEDDARPDPTSPAAAPRPEVQPARSTTLTRWAMPLLLAWSGFVLSGWVYAKKLDEPARAPTPKLLLALLGGPAFSTLLLVALRLVARRASREHSRHGDLLVVWVMTFLFAIHASVMAATIGMFPLRSGVPTAVALLLVGLGPVLASLEPNSAMGIRTRATLSDVGIWRRTHRLAGGLFVAAGIVGFASLPFAGRWVIFGSVVPALSAVVAAIIYAARQAPRPTREESSEEERPSG
jgi:uncharacterized membrane protein